MVRNVHEPFSTIAIFGKHAAQTNDPQWVKVAQFARDIGCTVLVEEETARNNPNHNFPAANETEIACRAQLGLVCGGDGTLLGVARRMAKHSLALLGINHGRLGFMTDIAQDDLQNSLLAVLKGHYLRDNRSIFKANIVRSDQTVCEALSINDVVVARGIVGGMVELGVHVDGQFMYDLRADGLIVSTPTGSTAYALSAHGPILHPRLQGLLLVPVAPHALTNRPIALPESATIEIEVLGGPETGVHFDMQSSFRLEVGDLITIAVDPLPVSLIHPASYDYFAMLRQKLHWSANPIDCPPKTRGSRDSGHAS